MNHRRILPYLATIFLLSCNSPERPDIAENTKIKSSYNGFPTEMTLSNNFYQLTITGMSGAYVSGQFTKEGKLTRIDLDTSRDKRLEQFVKPNEMRRLFESVKN
jgi:hypothetical protein